MNRHHKHLTARIPPNLHIHLARIQRHRQILLPHRTHMLAHKDPPLIAPTVLLEVLVERFRRIVQRYVRHLDIHAQQPVILLDQTLHDGYQKGVVTFVRQTTAHDPLNTRYEVARLVTTTHRTVVDYGVQLGRRLSAHFHVRTRDAIDQNVGAEKARLCPLVIDERERTQFGRLSGSCREATASD